MIVDNLEKWKKARAEFLSTVKEHRAALNLAQLLGIRRTKAFETMQVCADALSFEERKAAIEFEFSNEVSK